MRYLLRLFRREVVHPCIGGSVCAHCGSTAAASRRACRAAGCRRGVLTPVFSGSASARLLGDIVDIDVGIAIDVRGPGKRLAIGRERAGIDLPLVVGQPLDLLRRDVEQSHILVAVLRVGSNQDRPAVRREIVSGIGMFAFVLCQIRALPGGEVEHEDVRVLARRVRLGIDQELAVARKDRVIVAKLLGRVGRQMIDMTRRHVHQVNLETGAGLGLGDVGNLASIGRPRWFFLGALRRRGQVHHLSGLGRNQEDVPLLVAIVVGYVGDPGAVGRPRRLSLALVADGQLHRPTAARGHQPKVVAPAQVGNECDLLAVGRPRGAAHQPRHVELLDGEAAHVGYGLALQLGWFGDDLAAALALAGRMQ